MKTELFLQKISYEKAKKSQKNIATEGREPQNDQLIQESHGTGKNVPDSFNYPPLSYPTAKCLDLQNVICLHIH